MDKYQKQVEKTLLDHEAETFNELKKTYTTALRDIKIKVKQLQADVDILEKSNLENKSLLQSKIYQLNYQKAMEEQINSILDVVKNENVRNTQSFLTKMYEDSFLGVNYSLQKKGIPIIMPINNKNIVKVINKPTEGFKFTDRLYAHNKEFKKAVKSEISRGLALGSSYKEIAEQLSLATQVDLNKTYRIVRTEGGRVSSEAKLRSMNEAKKVGADIVKQWDATLDGKTRYQHGKLDQQWTEINEPFKVDGMEAMAPHGFGRADMDVNCRCVLLSVPRWDLEGTITKYDNSKGYLVETKNYQDWKQGYYTKVEELDIVKTVIAEAEERISGYKKVAKAVSKIKTLDEAVDILKGKTGEWFEKYGVDKNSQISPVFQIRKQLSGNLPNDELYDKNYEMKILQELDNFDDKPKIVNRQYFEKNNIEIIGYRGVIDYDDISAEEMIKQYKSGKLFNGSGVFGNGTYITTSYDEALWTYADNKRFNVMEIGLSKDAKIIKYDDLVEIRKELLDKYRNPTNTVEERFIATLLTDEGNLAEALGYDAIEIDNIPTRMEKISRIPTTNDDKTKYYVVLNRGKVLVVE